MKYINFTLVILLTTFPCFIYSQENKIELSCEVRWDKDRINLLQHYPYNEKKDSIYFTKIKFYISNLYIVDKNKRKSIGEVHLFDLENNITIYDTSTDKINTEKIGFLLGIDSLTNVSGANQGDLDPTKGMFWTWQSGYINIKIEGDLLREDGSLETFRYHLGGYRHPFVASKNLLFDVKNMSNKINLIVNLSTFIRFAMELGVNNIMSPGYKAKELTELFANGIGIE